MGSVEVPPAVEVVEGIAIAGNAPQMEHTESESKGGLP